MSINKFCRYFEDAKDQRPFLAMEIGYTRVTDWMVIIWDSAGTGLKDAPKIVQEQGVDLPAVLKDAKKSLAKYLKEKSKDGTGK